MCGIAGYFALEQAPPLGLVDRMLDQLAHRGPDGRGVEDLSPAHLGQVRLAIIDPSPLGRQPMSNEDGTVWIVFNGEIYNFAEIKRQLLDLGHVFTSATDTETIIHAYEAWGLDCLARFNGIFAFALWDQRQGRLWLVRDRLGVKPLFYAHLPQGILFGSEIKALLAHPGLERSLDLEGLAYFLSLNYVIAPITLFRSVRQLRPGEYLVADREGRVSLHKYWDILPPAQPRHRDWEEEFTALLEDSVRLELVSDVPFGAFLSGGLDSSAVVYWMSRHLRQPVRTFSLGFPEPGFNELPYAEAVAGILGTEHHQEMADPAVEELLPRLVWHAEEPTADSSMLAIYCLARRASQHVKMVLSGDGGDEILAGYPTYTATALCRLYRLLPAWFRRRILARLAELIPITYGKVSWDEKIRRFMAGADNPPEEAHCQWRLINDLPTRRRLLNPVWDYPEARADFLDVYRQGYRDCPLTGRLDRLLYVDTRLYLPNDMLVKVDRMTMAHALEARVPLLDHRLVELLAGAPPGLKLRWGYQTKYLLKKAMAGRLPRRIIHRPKKGFNVPKATWLKGRAQEFLVDTLSPGRVKDLGVIDPGEVQRLVAAHLSGRGEHSFQLWGLLTLVLWWERFRPKL